MANRQIDLTDDEIAAIIEAAEAQAGDPRTPIETAAALLRVIEELQD